MVTDNSSHRMHPHPLVRSFGGIVKSGRPAGRVQAVKGILYGAVSARTGRLVNPAVLYRRVLIETFPDMQNHTAHRVRITAILNPVEHSRSNRDLSEIRLPRRFSVD